MSEHKEEKKGEKKSLVGILIGVTGAIIVVWVFLIISGVTVPQAIAAGGNLLTESGRALSTFGTGGDSIASGIHQTRMGFTKVLIEILTFVVVGAIISWGILKIATIAGNAIKKTLKSDDGHH